MFEKNKMLWFIVIVAFGSAVAVLGAYDLKRKMAKEEHKGPKPDAHQIVEELKQADLDPFRAMLKKEGKSADGKAGDESASSEQGRSYAETLGLNSFMAMFGDEKSQEKNADEE